jgi:hypothetical protein
VGEQGLRVQALRSRGLAMGSGAVSDVSDRDADGGATQRLDWEDVGTLGSPSCQPIRACLVMALSPLRRGIWEHACTRWTRLHSPMPIG